MRKALNWIASSHKIGRRWYTAYITPLWQFLYIAGIIVVWRVWPSACHGLRWLAIIILLSVGTGVITAQIRRSTE